MSVARAGLRRLIRVEPGEVGALLWSFACFFCILCGYYILRPLRDEMGVQGGVENLPWLFSATFAGMLATVPLFGPHRHDSPKSSRAASGERRRTSR